jgi:hypothetical protein
MLALRRAHVSGRWEGLENSPFPDVRRSALIMLDILGSEGHIVAFAAWVAGQGTYTRKLYGR